MSGEQEQNDSQIFHFAWNTKAEDLFQGAEIIDQKTRGAHRGFQIMGVFLVIWMFLPNAVRNPSDWMSWIMSALGVALGLLVWKYPSYNNKKFAANRAAHSPTFAITETEDGLDVTEGATQYLISFDQAAVYEYKNVFAISFGTNELVAVPLDQMDEEKRVKFRALLRQELEGRYQKTDGNASRGILGRGR